MNNEMAIAYLAGAMDSDGFFGIKRSTYHMRVRGDASQPVYQERVGLKQVTPQVPQLLKQMFGGRCALQNPSTANGRPLWGWDATDRIASNATRAMLPHIRIKRRQAEAILELRATKEDSRYQQISYWFEVANPQWRSMPLVTFPQASGMLGYKGVEMVAQAVRNGTLLALPWANDGRVAPRIPLALVESVISEGKRSKDGRARCRPAELIAWRERLCGECRELNRIGTGLHPITERTGIYAPL